MSQSPYPKIFVENEIGCAHLYYQLFEGCPSVTFETVIEKPQELSQPTEFDDFNWDDNFTNAYKE